MFDLVSKYKPAGDQEQAIKKLVKGINEGTKEQVLLGATGTGKTFTIANVIKSVDKPTLILAHNKTLAGQLYSEFKELFPNNSVQYFISYYDYYQPEAYVASSDTYIEKDASINDEIDEMRHSVTAALLSRRDVIVIASVSCIYGIGNPDEYKNAMVFIRVGDVINRDNLLKKLIELTFERNDFDFNRGTFRAKGDTVEIIPTYEKSLGIRVEFFGDEVERIRRFDVVTGKAIEDVEYITIFPASQFMTNKEHLETAISRIENEMIEQIDRFKSEGKLIEAQRIEMRTKYDIEMLREMGICTGIENYSRHLGLREAGETPYTLIDFFDKDFLLVVDESHVTLPQVRGMFNGDRSRKQNLIDYGFRLPSALDNRPLRFEEFYQKINKAIYVSATPGEYEYEHKLPIIEQIIRPTGLLDPRIEIRPEEGQIDDLVKEIYARNELNERVLITTLTIKMSEDLTSYLESLGLKVAYLHSEVKALERLDIIRNLRLGKYDCLVGINLLREGLDLPEVSLVCILDANKQGFLRSERSLIQTMGRAARNSNGLVIMYADTISEAMRVAIDETNRRREIQNQYNIDHNITPTTIIKSVQDSISINSIINEETVEIEENLSASEIKKLASDLEVEMKKAAKELDFEKAANYRDLLIELRGKKKNGK